MNRHSNNDLIGQNYNNLTEILHTDMRYPDPDWIIGLEEGFHLKMMDREFPPLSYFLKHNIYFVLDSSIGIFIILQFYSNILKQGGCPPLWGSVSKCNPTIQNLEIRSRITDTSFTPGWHIWSLFIDSHIFLCSLIIWLTFSTTQKVLYATKYLIGSLDQSKNSVTLLL